MTDQNDDSKSRKHLPPHRSAPSPKNRKRETLEIIAAIIAAFLIYQGLAFATGTSMPIVSVVSASMYHTEPFDAWWADTDFYRDLDISEAEFRSYQNPNGLSVGDLIVVVRANEIERGDIIVYDGPGRFTIIHRVVDVDGATITTKGDNNRVTDQPFDRARVRGKAVFAVPLLGVPRLFLHWVGI